MVRWSVLLLTVACPAFADQMLATRMLPAGTVLSHSDLSSDGSVNAVSLIEQSVGKELRVAVYEGRPVLRSQLRAPTVIDRNQLITLAYEQDALRIETEGRALAAGGEGDVIRVMNLSSRATLMARVNSDGTATVAQR